MNEADVFDEKELRKLSEAHLRAVNYSTSKVGGMAFFRKLVQDLGNTLEVKWVFIGELSKNQSEDNIETLAIWSGNRWLDNFSYNLNGTPCQDVINQKPCFHACDIQKAYPMDHLLEEMGAESYLGTPLIGASGESLGVLVAMDNNPMDNRKKYLALSLLTVFATRSAAELQHRKKEAELEARVKEKTYELDLKNKTLIKNEMRLKHIAQHDELTGLANRMLFNEHFSLSLNRSQRHNKPLFMMMIDLDGFKAVNDNYGHSAGDKVLQTVAERLIATFRKSDLVSRLGGDEFAVILEDVTDAHFVEYLAQKTIDEVSKPITYQDTDLLVGCSIGISSSEGNSDANHIIETADQAMYQSKEKGKGCFSVSREEKSSEAVQFLQNDTEDASIARADLLTDFYTPKLNEDEKRKLTDESIRYLNESTSKSLGNEFFNILVKDLAQSLQVRYVIAGKIIVEDGIEKIKTLAVWNKDRCVPNITYELEHTPCHDVTCQTLCFHSKDIQSLYPEDTLLVDMEVESYVGLPMINTRGETVGTLSVMDTKPIDENKRYLAISLLNMFATRGAAELQHQSKQHLLETELMRKSEELMKLQEEIERLKGKQL